MSRVRCPDCGTLAVVGAAPYPRCRKCGRLLACCRHCRHYAPVMTECQAPCLAEPRRVTDPDCLMTCCRYPDSPLGRAARSPITIALGSAAVLALAILVVTQVFSRAWLKTEPVLFMRIPLAHTAQVQQSYLFSIKVLNPSEVPAEGLTVALDRRWLDHFEVDDISPMPVGEPKRTRQTVLLNFGTLPAGGNLEIVMDLRAKEEGTWGGQFTLLSDSGIRHKTIRSKVTVGP